MSALDCVFRDGPEWLPGAGIRIPASKAFFHLWLRPSGGSPVDRRDPFATGPAPFHTGRVPPPASGGSRSNLTARFTKQRYDGFATPEGILAPSLQYQEASAVEEVGA
jgi:hypothetical protein